MSTKTTGRAVRRERAEAVMAQQRRAERRMRLIIWGAVLTTLAGIVTAMLLTSKPQSSTDVRSATDFALTDTSGAKHTLAGHRGENLLLYFSEGAGCQSCLVQMGEIEKRAEAFAAEDVTVLPIVMNTREQILADMEINGVTTPFLLDDGTVSDAYGTLGKGMHAGLPGHSFVLIDKTGQQLWYGEYPSMWLDPGELLDEVRTRLAA
ncbi:peroxiredoxin family protein [Nocardioides ferulae]|uniref:peroxiredoxin family protein n=1 Tax=Nocardioides ferulae TaxID=2340821 RepID=UPI001F0CB5AE|nr:redoxin domain-containing protein [Nocardioides ferulae]